MQSPLQLVYEGQVVTLVDRERVTPAVVTRVVQQYRGPLTFLDVQPEGETGTRNNVPCESMRGQSTTFWKVADVVLTPVATVAVEVAPEPEPLPASVVVEVPEVAEAAPELFAAPVLDAEPTLDDAQ